MSTVLTAGASLVHIALAAIWLGAMAYSLVIVQPRALSLLGEQRFEEFAAVLAHGARISVLAVIAGLALSGALLTVLVAVDGRPTVLWWSLIVAKLVGLIAATAVFARVSWRLWPKRIFAIPDELDAVRRSFRVAATTLLALVAAQFVVGAIATAAR